MLRLLLTGILLLSGTTNQLFGQETPFQEYLLPALFEPQVAEALELSPDQTADLKTVLSNIKSTRAALITEFKQFAQTASADEKAEHQKILQATLDERKSKAIDEIESLLVPQQLDRLRQLAVQVAMKQTAKQEKLPSGFLAKPMREYLEIDDQQAEKIESESKRIQSDLQKKIAELINEAKSELLETLTPQQRKKYEALVGDSLENFRPK